MISVTNFIHSVELTKVLQTLPINKYLILDGNAKNPKTFESSDVLILNVNQAKSLKRFLDKNQLAVILYVENAETASTMYESAKQINAFAVISPMELSKLNNTIDEAYESVLEKRKSQFGKGKTIGVFSVKGGVGKSFISYHLASKLSLFTKVEPLLIDAGVPFGSAHALLNIDSKSSWQVLRPLLKTGKDLTSTRLNAQILKTQFQFHLLNAPQNLTEEHLSSVELGNLLSGVKQSYPITIVDLPSFEAKNLELLSNLFDLNIWVFTPDANSIVLTIEIAKQISKFPNENLNLFVCNMVEPTLDHSLITSLQQKLSPNKILTIDYDSEAVKIYQRKFELLSDESLLLTKQLKELAQTVFFKLSQVL